MCLAHETLDLGRLLRADVPSLAEVLADGEGDLPLPGLEIVGLLRPARDSETVRGWYGCDGGDVREIGFGGLGRMPTAGRGRRQVDQFVAELVRQPPVDV